MTLSGPVLYTNLLGIFPMFMFASAGNEYRKFQADFLGKDIWGISPVGFGLLLLGCIAGTGIGYSSWWCRDKVSATSFTLIGVLNKCLTVLLNVAIWKNHAPPAGIASLFLCLVGGVIYEQSPMRATATSSPKLVPSPSDEESEWHDSAHSPENQPLMDDASVQLDMMETETSDNAASRRRV